MRPVIALLIVTLGCSAERDFATAVVGDSADLHSGPGIQSAACISRVPPAIISLTVGQSARLSQNGSRLCFRLGPFPGSKYVLAYADPRLADQAKTTAEWPWPDSVRVEVADITSQAAPAPPVLIRSVAPGSFPGRADRFQQPRPAPLAVPAFCSTSSGLGNPYCRTTPWTLGEVFTLRPNDGVRPPQPAKVVRISGQLVVAVIQADAAELSSMGLARLDTALAFMQQRVLPLLARVYAVPNPVTTQESGQLLLMLESQTTYNFASFFNDPPDRGRFSFLSFRLGQGTAWTDAVQNANSLIEIISHEMTHGFQQRWRYAHGPWTNYLGTLWAVEGSATFVQQHMAREFASVGFLSDFSQPQVNPDNKLWNLMTLTYNVKNLTSGYGDASSFLRDLVQRLMTDQGMGFDPAVTAVLVGALEGWYGINEDNQIRSTQNLLDLYRSSVGSNAGLLLNVPPNRDGLLSAADVSRLNEFGSALRDTFAKDLAVGAAVESTASSLQLSFPSEVTFDHVEIQEDIEHGQNVAKHEVAITDADVGRLVATGSTVGYKRIHRLPRTRSRQVRLEIRQTFEPARISRVGLYLTP